MFILPIRFIISYMITVFIHISSSPSLHSDSVMKLIQQCRPHSFPFLNWLRVRLLCKYINEKLFKVIYMVMHRHNDYSWMQQQWIQLSCDECHTSTIQNWRGVDYNTAKNVKSRTNSVASGLATNSLPMRAGCPWLFQEPNRGSPVLFSVNFFAFLLLLTCLCILWVGTNCQQGWLWSQGLPHTVWSDQNVSILS